MQPQTTARPPVMKRSKARGSIYTIGYDHMSPKRLIEVLDALDVALLIDCRSNPWSRIPGFDKASLVRSLGSRTSGAAGSLAAWATGRRRARSRCWPPRRNRRAGM
jgi:uncharacterized protein (DUF488 family)